MDFEPKREDGRPVYRVIYDHIVREIDCGSIKVGDIIPHEELKSLLTTGEQKGYYSIVSKASKKFEVDRKRALESVRGIGYRLAAGEGQVDMGRRQQKAAGRRIKRAVSLVKTSDRSLMTPEVRKNTHLYEMLLIDHELRIKRQEERLDEKDQQFEDLRSAQMRSSLYEKESEKKMKESEEKMAEINSQLRELRDKLKEELKNRSMHKD